MFDRLASEDFWRAYRKSFWRKIGAWLSGRSNELLPYDEVRRQLPLEGQRDIGLQEVRLEKIIGSVGRYRDFDRAFLPSQLETSQRWINISKARYQDIDLPPVELYKLGDVYFVRDGNHRISVARERGQSYIDAYVTEIEVPIPLTPATELDDLIRQREYALFRQQTGISRIRPEADLELTLPEQYSRLHEHISAHRWYLGLERNAEIGYQEAVGSWYDNVYVPLVEAIRDHSLTKEFPERTLADLYLWVSEYQWLLREANLEPESDIIREATDKLAQFYNRKAVMRVVNKLRQATWIDDMIRSQEHARFLEASNIAAIRPEADLSLSLPGQYDKLLEHISVHRWYLGVERETAVPYEEAVASWYDNVYLPLVRLIREQQLLKQFPNRTEADLYLWVMEHRSELSDQFADTDATRQES